MRLESEGGREEGGRGDRIEKRRKGKRESRRRGGGCEDRIEEKGENGDKTIVRENTKRD